MLAGIYFIILKVLKVGVGCGEQQLVYQLSWVTRFQCMFYFIFACLFVFFSPLNEINSFVRNSSSFLIRHLH